ncbi:acetyltransferase domain-containing protein [Reticulomyxa filosa]|uniref:Acetyltransferase domain-containing protein n=1 Tax=Reticulomyxa filosa TaxID=46433 RepID=X6NV48_RETFI|nr:acetyltransferase domain-containing protein [Reticulomyxa filosa]|eukprot:ETO29679.1 acetyltransferase domain-containing protein [Reticulomyxa filosa]
MYTYINKYIDLLNFCDETQLCELYSAQYPEKIQQQYKSIRKYVKKALKSDLSDIDKYYLSKEAYGFWVAVLSDDTSDKDAQVQEGKIIGMIGVQENKSWFDHNSQNDKLHKAEIVRLGVHESHRKCGVGTALLQHLLAFCKSCKYDLIVATTMNVLPDAIAFYETNGFERLHTELCASATQSHPPSSYPCHKGDNSTYSLQFLRYALKIDSKLIRD